MALVSRGVSIVTVNGTLIDFSVRAILTPVRAGGA